MALDKPELDLWFSYNPRQNDPIGNGWKLHDIRLPELDKDLNWFESITEATRRFNVPNGVTVSVDYKISLLF